MRVCISTLRVCPACGPAAKTHVLPPSLVLSTSSVLQEPGLESLLALLEQMVISSAIDFKELLGMLREKSDSTLGKHAVGNLAKCIGVITAATTPENRQEVVTNLLSTLEGAGAPTDPDGVRQMVLSLLVSGDLGRVFDYNTLDDVAARMQAIYLSSFNLEAEEIKHAASYALGRASIGSPAVFLQAIVSALDSGDAKKQYLLLSSLREFIRCHQKMDGQTGMADSIPVILPQLLDHCSDADEGARSMVAECMGSLTCVQPTVILAKLQELVSQHSTIKAPDGHVADSDEESKKNSLVCWTVATSIKHAVASKAPVSDLAMAMPDFLRLLQVEEVSVRNASLLMVYSAVHHMPQLVASFMKELIMPSLYEVAKLKLQRVVDLGPFKHTVDDALPLRKSAMSIFATCQEKLPGSLDIAAFMPVLAGALDDLEDVQLQAHQIVVSMSVRHPTYLVAAVDDFVPAFTNMFMDKTIKRKTANKTGTELERAKEWIKSGLRALLAMSKLEGVMNNRRFARLVERVQGDQKFRPMLDAIDEER
eukprot:CAMPEP_0116858918 /NCGR_PEP_ID=MMETSP0418-20121206/21468_1 /TAXON_ID=1158023 /ORGANISM="Astrosyne radiata, Strain 13vi08-1A" /LENGTH=536 /DNA_ID=CAMNT_0004492951 /DNA_START=238 /DNA_END=1848 /DNA_ORIENTATION=-